MPYFDCQKSPCGQYKRITAKLGDDLIYFDTKRRYASWTFEIPEIGDFTVTFEGDHYSRLFKGMRHGDGSSPATVLKHMQDYPLRLLYA